MSSRTVSITIVTFNSAQFIARCLQHVFEQDYPCIEVIVVDNASTDGTPEILCQFNSRIQFVWNSTNVGFAAGHNQAIATSKGGWILTLNPDVRLKPNFVSTAVVAGEMDSSVGSVSGKLLRMKPDFDIPATNMLDSTGIYFTPALRHFDRGSGEADLGAYNRLEYVFGVTGAAGLYRREMIEDVSIDGEFFDNDFFAYREDADLAWRAQLLGWKCLYVPDAVAYHVRNVLPSNRKSLAAAINMHSVKNRFLMRIKNITADLYLRHVLAISFRDVLVAGACLLREFTSLRAFPIILRSFRRTLTKRRQILRRRRVDSKYMGGWFSNKPTSFPAMQIDAKSTVRAVAPR